MLSCSRLSLSAGDSDPGPVAGGGFVSTLPDTDYPSLSPVSDSDPHSEFPHGEFSPDIPTYQVSIDTLPISVLTELNVVDLGSSNGFPPYLIFAATGLRGRLDRIPTTMICLFLESNPFRKFGHENNGWGLSFNIPDGTSRTDHVEKATLGHFHLSDPGTPPIPPEVISAAD